jgi:hypothetical protein
MEKSPFLESVFMKLFSTFLYNNDTNSELISLNSFVEPILLFSLEKTDPEFSFLSSVYL